MAPFMVIISAAARAAINQYLEQAIRDQRLSWNQLAKRADVSIPALQDLRKGSRHHGRPGGVTENTLLKLDTALGQPDGTLERIIREAGNPPRRHRGGIPPEVAQAARDNGLDPAEFWDSFSDLQKDLVLGKLGGAPQHSSRDEQQQRERRRA
jgi:transcriptional regulator with XRE-family HTH domain